MKTGSITIPADVGVITHIMNGFIRFADIYVLRQQPGFVAHETNLMENKNSR
jgi:hypothetical protein